MRNTFFFLLLLIFSVPALGQPSSEMETDAAQRVYDAFGDAVSQIQVIDVASGRKSSIGSGFQFTPDGYIATNYHVVASAIRRPGNNRVEYVHDGAQGDGGSGTLQIVAADVVNDLAILKMDKPGKTFVSLRSGDVRKGTRLFALGNPHDIGFTIIEGTYNGFAQDSLADKIHFSGSLNPGMSGGPALLSDGSVVGINVSTAGNQISFLVPARALEELHAVSLQEGQSDFLKDAHTRISTQLQDAQQNVVDRLLKDTWESVPLGPLMVPGRVHPSLKCWGESAHEEKDPFLYYRSACMTQDRIYVDDDFETGNYDYRYSYIVAKPDMDAARFYSFYEDQYAQVADLGGHKDEMTNFVCHTRFIEQAGLPWKTSFCIRRYKKYPAMHDMQLTMAMLSPKKEGMLVTLTATGVSQANALRLSEHFIKELRAAPPVDVAKAKEEPL